MLKPLFLKMFFSFLCLCVLGSNFWTMRNWTERTGVYDDICYLRQAHLFQRFGLGGFDTNITRDDDGYFATLAREIGYQAWNDPARAVPHPNGGKARHPVSARYRVGAFDFPGGFSESATLLRREHRRLLGGGSRHLVHSNISRDCWLGRSWCGRDLLHGEPV